MLVSVVVPVYKVENYIDRCARSLFSQTYKETEFLFVDDCSPDNSIGNLQRTIEEFPDLNSQIHIIKHEKNRGSSAARNTGIKEASGNFLFFVDADDYVEENAIELLMARQKETDTDIVSGKALRHFKDRVVEMSDSKYETKEEFVCNLIQYTFDHVLWRRVIRKSLFVDNDIWMKEGTNLAEDWQVITRLAYYARCIAQIDDIIYHYNSTNENSYMYSLDNYNENLYMQELDSMTIVSNFFMDKEIIYQDAVHKMEVSFYYTYLKRSVSAGDKDLYYFYLSKLESCSSDYLKYIGWNNPIRRISTHSFNIFRIYRSITLCIFPIYKKICSFFNK